MWNNVILRKCVFIQIYTQLSERFESTKSNIILTFLGTKILLEDFFEIFLQWIGRFVYFWNQQKFSSHCEQSWKDHLKRMATVDPAKEKALSDYRGKLLEHREVDARLKNMREELKGLTKQYDK